jgi:uncharacterized membrane protein
MFYLIGGFLLFVVLLLIIIIIVFKKSPAAEEELVPVPKQTLSSLVQTLKTEKSDLSKIEESLEIMLKRYPFPENDQEAEEHYKFVYFFARNPLSTAKLIVQMQKRLCEANPKHAKAIEDFQMRGVDARKK